jgi:hypothetical protein
MYSLNEMADDPETFRRAVLNAQAFRPLYAKIKLICGCNLKWKRLKRWANHLLTTEITEFTEN